MGKVVLTTLNAKFIHRSLALKSLKAFCSDLPFDILIKEFTINMREGLVASELFKLKADVIAFSCYIWNISMTLSIISVLKKVLPDVKIVVGGPEITDEFKDEMVKHGIDVAVIGEGEKPFKMLLEHYYTNSIPLSSIDGIMYTESGDVFVNKPTPPISLDEIPFAYADDLLEYNSQIIYYESSRGCPFSCSYCLSAADKDKVRFLSFERVQSDLAFFIKSGVKQVKFIDRTFNCNKTQAMSIWRFLIENDNGNCVTNFHFEIAADLLDADMLSLLKTARKGLFQFEIGIQSTNEQTLCAIRRKTNTEKVLENVRLVKSFGNIHQHVDLIAGLPYEGFTSFKKSFNDVYAVKAEMIQLGFLKLLKGSPLRAEASKHGIVCKENADYEVLYTNYISHKELLHLKALEEILELFYNSNCFVTTVSYIEKFFDTPFDFYESVSKFWEEKQLHMISLKKLVLYEMLYEFCKWLKADLRIDIQIDLEIVRQLMLFDLLRSENVKSIPAWLCGEVTKEQTEFAYAFYSSAENRAKYFKGAAKDVTSRQLMKNSNFQKFSIDVFAFADKGVVLNEECFVLFNYYTGFVGRVT